MQHFEKCYLSLKIGCCFFKKIQANISKLLLSVSKLIQYDLWNFDFVYRLVDLENSKI